MRSLWLWAFALSFIGAGNCASFEAKLGSDVEQAILRGDWEDAKKHVLKSHETSMDISAIVRSTVQAVRSNADELVRLLDKKHSAVLRVPPAFQWAQDDDAIYLLIKFAYRWSSPGSLQVERETIEAVDKSFLFAGYGTGSHLGKLYELDLGLYGAIKPSTIDWTFGSVGKLSVVLQKARRGQWPRLTESTEKISNMHIWWERREQLEKQMKVDRKREQDEADAKFRVVADKHYKAENEKEELLGEKEKHSPYNMCERNQEYRSQLEKKIAKEDAAKKPKAPPSFDTDEDDDYSSSDDDDEL